MQFDKDLECGVPVIDHEHREMIRHLSDLMDETRENRIQEMLAFLKDYVVVHFAHEQLLHRDSRYPKAEEHKRIHKDFIQTFLDLEEEYHLKGNNPATLQRLIRVANDWLIEHIMGQDREFADYYLSREPTEASPAP